MSRAARIDFAVALLLVIALLVAAYVRPDERPPAVQVAPVSVLTFQGKGIQWWARHAVQARKDANARAVVIRRLRHARLVRFVPPYEHAAKLAAVAYGVDARTLIRKGRCESARWTHFTNRRSHAEGPWQFLPSTWATTPFASFSPYDPDAAALAAAWMHAAGRGGQWRCK